MFLKSSKAEYLFLALFLFFGVLFVGKLIKEKQYKESLEYFVGEGASMEPTIKDGEEIVADPNKIPEKNDIMVFRCDKCKSAINEIDILTKRVIRKNDQDCLWVEGDNKQKSLDSRNFGWLCPEEIEFLGVVLIDYGKRI